MRHDVQSASGAGASVPILQRTSAHDRAFCTIGNEISYRIKNTLYPKDTAHFLPSFKKLFIAYCSQRT